LVLVAVQVLPCVVDVGTDNVVLRRDPLYCGLDMPRLTGKAYYEVLDEVGALRATLALHTMGEGISQTGTFNYNKNGIAYKES
jgi:hypothetical protein